MSWKDRAVKVEEGSPATGGWRSRAVAVEPDTLEGFGKNLEENAKEVAGNLIHGGAELVRAGARTPGMMMDTASEMAMGLPFSQTPMAERYKTIGRGAYNAIKSLGPQLKDVVTPQKWYEKPVDQAITAGSIVFPALKAGKAAAFAKAAGAAEVAEGASLPAKIFAKGTRVATGLPEETTLARLENPNAVKTAFTHPEVAEQVAGAVSNFEKKIGDLTEAARSKLSTSPYLEEGALPKTDVVDMVKSAKREIGAAHTPELKAAKKALTDIQDSFQKKLKSTVSESQIKDRIVELDKNINWDNPAVSQTNEALVSLRRKLDGVLKGRNQAYAKAMEPVDEAITVRDKLKKTFDIKYDRKEGFQPGNNTVNRLKGSLRENRLEDQGVLRRFEAESGEDLTSRIKNANAKADYAAEATRPGTYARAGVAGTVGEVAGHMLGLPPAVGGAIGFVGGAIADIYGRGFAGRVTDALSKIALTPRGARYVSMLETAASKGPRNVAIVHATLLRDDPQYAALMRNVPVPTQSTSIAPGEQKKP